MKFAYYPGCSLEGTALEYNESTRAMMQCLDVQLDELPDWTCCGASAADPLNYLLSLALPARNLALAEQMEGVNDLLVPCSACYLNLKKVEEKTRTDPELRQKLNTILAAEEIRLNGTVRVRHLLDVISSEAVVTRIRERIKCTFSGLRIAPYYGCQCLRPYPVFDDPEEPRSMEALIQAAGAAVHPWDMGGKCCGASHMNTKMSVGLELVGQILEQAQGADAIVTVCPMCQMNLEAYQQKISKLHKRNLHMTILYLPQLLGLAMGLSEKDMRIDLNLSITRDFRDTLGRMALAA